MTWTDKLEQLITKIEFLFLEEKAAIIDILTYPHAKELDSYLGLDQLGLNPLQKSWTIVIFLHVMAKYSKGEHISYPALLALMSSGLNDMNAIEDAIRVLEVKQVMIKKTSRFRPRPEVTLEVVPFTINKIMQQFPLPVFERDEINAKKLMVRLRDHGYDIIDFGSKDVQKSIDEFCSVNSFNFLKKLDAYKSIQGESKYLLILLIAAILASNSNQHRRIKDSYSFPIESNRTIMQLSKGDSKLIKLGLVEAAYDEFVQEVQIALTDKALEKFIPKKRKASPKEKNGGAGVPGILKDQPEQDFFKIIPNKLIDAETLFYNQHLHEALDFYKNLLNKEDKIYRQNPAIKGRMILMFDGLPGTGKTAAAQQLARESNRDLVHVNWQTFRGQWVGQSEKNLQVLLEDIDKMAIKSKRIPVVLFNEAEAFLSQRIAINQSTDRMENNLVSLLLEWLEKKDPFCIVIFTSNHRQLMDKAFERRIAHINFDLPDESTRIKIWHSLAGQHGLSDQQIHALAQYELSGAEIAQVLKTYNLHQIAYELEKLDMPLLHRLCKGQKWMEQKSAIGFKTVE